MRCTPWFLAATTLWTATCAGDKRPEAGGPPGAEPAAGGPDPCSLVSAAEIERLIGPLAEPPYRVNADREPAANGEGCLYRARDLRNVTILVDWTDGDMGFRMLAGTGGQIQEVLTGYDPATDTLEGAWDKVGAAFGQFIALKDSVSVQVDPLGSRIGLGGAAKLASIAIGRIASPLPYRGAEATRTRTERPPRTGDPCRLVTRAEVERLMGPLRSDPRPADDGSGCEFATTQEMLGQPVTRTLEVTWNDGFYLLGQERMGAAGAAKTMATHLDADLPTLSEEAAGGGEPWDERLSLLGGLITVVKRDVLLRIAGDGVGGFDEGKAMALLRLAVSRLPEA